MGKDGKNVEGVYFTYDKECLKYLFLIRKCSLLFKVTKIVFIIYPAVSQTAIIEREQFHI